MSGKGGLAEWYAKNSPRGVPEIAEQRAEVDGGSPPADTKESPSHTSSSPARGHSPIPRLDFSRLTPETDFTALMAPRHAGPEEESESSPEVVDRTRMLNTTSSGKTGADLIEEFSVLTGITGVLLQAFCKLCSLDRRDRKGGLPLMGISVSIGRLLLSELGCKFLFFASDTRLLLIFLVVPGHMREARSTLLEGHIENTRVSAHWRSSPRKEDTSASVSSITEFAGRMETPARAARSSEAPEAEDLQQQLLMTERRMEQLESQMEQGSRALDVANVKLAEQLLLCSTVSARLLLSETPDKDLADLQRESEEGSFRILNPPEILPDDSIVSLSPSESGERDQSGFSQDMLDPGVHRDAHLDTFLTSGQLQIADPHVSSPGLEIRRRCEMDLGSCRIYCRVAKYMFRQHQEKWRKSVFHEWSTACKRELSLRRKHAKFELRSDWRCLQKVFGSWVEAEAVQEQECDWDCGFIGTPDEVALHEQNCEAMLLSTAWKHDTALSRRAHELSCISHGVHRKKFRQWLPAGTRLAAIDEKTVKSSCASSTVHRYGCFDLNKMLLFYLWR
jgi:hypothetical protein